jgi:ribosomal protein L11 methyltransferase
MYLWKRRATWKWANENEDKLRTIGGDRLAIIERPNRKQLQLEVSSDERRQLEIIAKRFGGRIEKLPRDWLNRALRRKTYFIRIGARLIIANSRSGALRRAVCKKSADWRPPLLVIPAGAAFGTGEHATTAMSLRMLGRMISHRGARSPEDFPARRRKEHARRMRSPELVLDLGTGSGILALAARLLGAKRVIAIDNDPIAISTAKQNARLNNVRSVSFRVADVRTFKLPRKIDIVTANLFSELLIEILPKLRTARRLVISGILRTQERAVRRTLDRNRIDIKEVRRRGKWVAILAASS